MLAALGYEWTDNDNDQARAMTGALLLVELCEDMRLIRRWLGSVGKG